MNTDYSSKTILAKRPLRKTKVGKHRIQPTCFALRLPKMGDVVRSKSNKSIQTLYFLINAHHPQTKRSEGCRISTISTPGIK